MAKSSLYETITLTTICSNNASILTFARPGWVYVAADKTVSLVPDNSSEITTMKTFEFDSTIDAMGWSEETYLLVVGDRSGILHFVSLTVDEVLFSQDLGAQNASEVPVFREIQFTKLSNEGLSDLLVLGRDDVLLVFQSLQLTRLKNGLLVLHCMASLHGPYHRMEESEASTSNAENLDLGAQNASEVPVFREIQFTKLSNEGLSDLLVLGRDDVLLVFQSLQLTRLKNALLQQDMQVVKQIQSQIKLSQLDLSTFHDAHAASIFPVDNNYSTATSLLTSGCGSHALCLWEKAAGGCYSVIDSLSYFLQGDGVIKCGVTSDGSFLVTLTDNHTVVVWFFSSLIMVNIWTGEPVLDFTLCQSAVGHQNGSNHCTDRLCLITKDSEGQRFLSIVGLPGLNITYCLSVSPATTLCQGNVTDESLYFIDVGDETMEKPARFEVKHLIQALPEDRLATLLAQQKFEEAEAFAIKFNLDPELVYERKARVLNDLLCRVPAEESLELRTSLTQCLDHIKDDAFVVDIALGSSYPSLEITLELLYFAKNKLKPASSGDNDGKAMRMKVFNALNRLTTFQMIHGEEGFSPSAWHSFLEGSMLAELGLQLQVGNLQHASWIWNRHQPALLPELDCNNLLPLIAVIPESVFSSQLAPWLTENIVPFILQYMAELMGDFLSWTEERIRTLELTEKDLWPSNALNMVNLILEAVNSFKNLPHKVSINLPTVTAMDFSSDVHSPLAGLKTLQEKLSDLHYLHTSLQCPICLTDYEKESHEAVVFRLLDKVIAAELVPSTIQSTVLPYVERHGLQLDHTLLQYIQLFLGQAPRYSTVLSDSPWEAKAIAIIQTIKDRELYVTACVELLKHVRTPWSESVEAIVQECLKLKHPSVSMLQKQYKLLQLKKMLHGYGVRDFNFSNPSKGMMYIRRILAHGGTQILEDALQVAEMYQLNASQVYMHYIMQLGLQDKADSAVELLRKLPRKEQLVTLQNVFTWAYGKLQYSFSLGLDEPQDYIGATRVAIMSLKFLKGCLQQGETCVICEDWVNISEKIDLLERLLALQVEYSVFLTPQELSDSSMCQQMFKDKVQEFQQHQLSLTEVHLAEQMLSSKHYHSSVRFCQLVGYSENELFAAAAMSCAENNKMNRARDICCTLAKHSPSPNTALLLSSIVQEVWVRMREGSAAVTHNDVQAAQDLSALATTLCHPNDLLDCVELYQLSSLLCDIHSQCEGASNGIEEGLFDKDSKLTQWSWDHRFREDGLVLEQSSIIPLVVEYARARLPCVIGREWIQLMPFQCRSTTFKPEDSQKMLGIASQLNQLLQDNGHTQLTLRCTVQTIGSYSVLSSVDQTDPFLLKGQAIIHEVLRNLINRVLSSKRVDHSYALAILLMMPPHQAVEKLQATRTSSISKYSKVIALCKLAVDYGQLMDQPAVVELSRSIQNSAEWGKRLSKHKPKIPFTEAFRGGHQEKARVVSGLFRNRDVTLELIFQYFHDFGLEVQSMLVSYLRVLLTEWDTGYQERVTALLQHIRNKHICHELLANLLTRKVTPYDYEKIAFVLQSLKEVEQAAQLKPEQGLLLLDCLKMYPRATTPSQYERMWYAEKYCTVSGVSEEQSLIEVTLPESSKTRLPFHTLLYGTAMEIIAPELSKETVGKLEPIAKILKLSQDKFFSSAIRNVVTKSLNPADKTELSPHSSCPVTFADVAPLLARIQNFNFALTVTKWLAKQLQNDTDHMEALKVAVTIAMQGKEQAESKDQRMKASESVEMFQQLLKITQVEHLLQHHKLNQAEFMELSNQGATLIMTLFTDVHLCEKPVPPVHSIAAEIASIYNLNLDKIKRKLIEQWLPATGSSNQEMDVTQMSILEDPTDLTDGEEESEDQLSMKRLLYLLNVPENLEAHSQLLLSWAKRTSSNASCLSRVRALQILFVIAPPDLIENVSGAPIKDIRGYMQCVLFVSELEALHMSTSVSAFQSCNKEGLVKGLWRNHSHEPRALRLICELCLHYQIFDTSLWNRILDQLLSLRLLPYLRHVLKTLASYPGHWSISSMPPIWLKTVLAPFQEAAVPLMGAQRQECVESLKMLYGCPFPFELDISRVVSAFCCVEMRAHALAASLMLPTHSERDKATKTVLRGLESQQVITLLDDLSNEGHNAFFTVVVEKVYQYLNSTGQHEALLGSPHFTAYVHFLISRKTMDDLLIKTLQVKRVKEAVRLVEMYNEYHHQPSQLQGTEALQDYLTTHELNTNGCYDVTL